MTADNDISNLFETHTVPQIEEYLNKTRSDIEKKKEDLRIMVGERYRDLIDAANTIAEMQNSAQSISNNVETVEGLCGSLQQRGLIGFKTKQIQPAVDDYRSGVKSNLYSIAIQVKLLVSIPEVLWSLTEKGEYLAAAQLYLLAQHTHTVLQLSPQAPKVFSWFPVIERQWASISQFSSTIVQGSTNLIRSEIHDLKNVLDAIVAIMLIEGHEATAALDLLLKLRSETLKNVLQSKPSVTSKAQISEFVSLLISSVNCIGFIFTRSKDGSLSLEMKIDEITNPSIQDKTNPINLLNESALSLSFLPSSIMQFRPSFNGNFSTLTDDYVQSQFSNWLKDVITDAKQSLGVLLAFNKSIKALAMIRSSVLEITTNQEKDENLSKLSESCIKMVDPWADVIQEVMTHRAKTVITNQLSSATNGLLDMVKKLLQDIKNDPRICCEEGDITSFVWTESSGDIPDKVGWSSASTRSITENAGLYYKTRGYTSRIQAVCKSLNARLVSLIEDVSNYSLDESSTSMLLGEDLSKEEKSAIQDYEILLEFLSNETKRLFNILITNLEHLINDNPVEDPNDSNLSDDFFDEDKQNRSLGIHSTSVVVIARVCHALTNICPQLQICASATLLRQMDVTRKMSLGVKVETDSWTELSGNLLNSNTRFMTKFISSLVHNLSIQIKKDFETQLSNDLIEKTLTFYPSWETVAIEEESETGEKVKSDIYFPGHPTPSLVLFLTRVCSAINCVALHTVTRSAQSELVSCVGNDLIEVYESIDTTIINQSIALQITFDLKYIQALLISRDNKDLNSRVGEAINNFESLIDPFDLDVFVPHMTSRVRAATQRSQVILGILIPRDKQLLSNRTSSSTSTVTTNNTLPLIPIVDIPRFSTVPLPATSSLPSRLSTLDSSGLGATIVNLNIEDKKKRAHNQPTKDMSSAAIAASRSAASLFSAAMSSSWFGSSNTS